MVNTGNHLDRLSLHLKGDASLMAILYNRKPYISTAKNTQGGYHCYVTAFLNYSAGLSAAI